MLGALVMNLREGFEMALIISVILAYLNRVGQRKQFRQIWLGVVLAGAVCTAAAAILFLLLGEAREGNAQMMIEAFAMLVAVCVLTYMIFWMRRAGANLTRTIRSKVDAAVQNRSVWALTILAFVSVLREGVEAVLFTIASAQNSSPGAAILGAVIGLSAAALFGVAIYRGARVLDVKAFFKWTGFTLIIICAGLLAGAIRELHELGWVPRVISYLWDTSGVLSEDSLAGGILRSLVGYDSSPSLVQVAAYWGYLIVTMTAFLRPVRMTEIAAPQERPAES